MPSAPWIVAASHPVPVPTSICAAPAATLNRMPATPARAHPSLSIGPEPGWMPRSETRRFIVPPPGSVALAGPVECFQGSSSPRRRLRYIHRGRFARLARYDPPMLRSTLRPGRALALALVLAAAAPRPAAATVLVESAQAPPGSLSPLAPGDELLRWQRSGATPLRSGDFAHWGDLDLLAFLESPRGTLEIDLLRQGEPRRVTLPPAAWTFRGRPTGVDPALVERVAQLAARESTATFEQVEPLLAGAPAEVRSWAWTRFADAAGKRSGWRTAQRALATAIPLSPPHVAADLERLHGDALRRLNRLDEAEAAYRRALALWEGLEPRGLGSTFAINALANLRAAQYELAEANRLFLEVAEIRGRLAPGSWLHANALNGLGTTAGRRNDLAAAERHFEEALALAERGHGDPGPPLSNLGIVCRLRGDFERAEMYTRRALELYRAADNRSEVADKRVNLANILGDARRFDEALAVYGEALAELEGDAPDREALGTALANRANLHWQRRDLAALAADLAAVRGRVKAS
ncbi:MAG: tetratricopeptide repeat protein, partial [Thermoanaerobaculia bacterium]